MIPIKKEPPEYFKKFKVYENCFFCNNETNMWNTQTNQPVCNKCAENHDLYELTIKTNIILFK